MTAGPTTTIARFTTGMTEMIMQGIQITKAVMKRPSPWRRWYAPKAVFLPLCMTIAMMKPMMVTYVRMATVRSSVLPGAEAAGGGMTGSDIGGMGCVQLTCVTANARQHGQPR